MQFYYRCIRFIVARRRFPIKEIARIVKRVADAEIKAFSIPLNESRGIHKMKKSERVSERERKGNVNDDDGMTAATTTIKRHSTTSGHMQYRAQNSS